MSYQVAQQNRPEESGSPSAVISDDEVIDLGANLGNDAESHAIAADPSHEAESNDSEEKGLLQRYKEPRYYPIYGCVVIVILVVLIVVIYEVVRQNENNGGGGGKKNSGEEGDIEATTPAPTAGSEWSYSDNVDLDSITLPSDDFDISIYFDVRDLGGRPRALRHVKYNDTWSIVYVYALIDGPEMDGTPDVLLRVWQPENGAPASLAVSAAMDELWVATSTDIYRCMDAHSAVIRQSLAVIESSNSNNNGTLLSDSDWRLDQNSCEQWMSIPLTPSEKSYNARRYLTLFEDELEEENVDDQNSTSSLPIPQGSLCVANGVTCEGDSCVDSVLEFPHASIVCFPDLDDHPSELNANTSVEEWVNRGKMIVVGRGIRNSVGLDFDPESGDFWFTDTGIDDVHDDYPDDELNRVHSGNIGEWFGFPYCHALGGGDPHSRTPGCVEWFRDPDLSDEDLNCSSNFTHPEYALGPHVTALGLRFYHESRMDTVMFGDDFKGVAFIAQRGSSSRADYIGYRVVAVKMDSATHSRVSAHLVFAEGWLDTEDRTYFGRPVDVQPLMDGSLLISDDSAGLVYRVTRSNGPEKDHIWQTHTDCSYSYIP